MVFTSDSGSYPDNSPGSSASAPSATSSSDFGPCRLNIGATRGSTYIGNTKGLNTHGPNTRINFPWEKDDDKLHMGTTSRSNTAWHYTRINYTVTIVTIDPLLNQLS